MEKSKLYTPCAADDPDALGVQAQGTAISCDADPGVVGFVNEAAALGDAEAKTYRGTGTDGDAEPETHRDAEAKAYRGAGTDGDAETKAYSGTDAKAKAHAKALADTGRRTVVRFGVRAAVDVHAHPYRYPNACPFSLRAEDYQTAQQRGAFCG